MDSISIEDQNKLIGYAVALQNIMTELTGDNTSAKLDDPLTFYDDGQIMYSYAFDLKNARRRHPISDFKSVDEISDLMLKEAVNWCRSEIKWTDDVLVSFALFHAKRMRNSYQSDNKHYAKDSLRLFIEEKCNQD